MMVKHFAISSMFSSRHQSIAIGHRPLYHNGMFATCTIPFVIVVAGFIAGAGLDTFMSAAAGAALAVWRIRIIPSPTHRVFVNLEPDAPDGTILLQAIRETLARIQNTKRAALLRVSAFTASGHPRLSLGLTRNGDLELACDRQRPRQLGQPGVWIADHPLPLIFPHTRCLTLRFAPTDSERVRISFALVPTLSQRVWLAIGVVAAITCVLEPRLFAATLGFACQAYLLEHNPDRASH